MGGNISVLEAEVYLHNDEERGHRVEEHPPIAMRLYLKGEPSDDECINYVKRVFRDDEKYKNRDIEMSCYKDTDPCLTDYTSEKNNKRLCFYIKINRPCPQKNRLEQGPPDAGACVEIIAYQIGENLSKIYLRQIREKLEEENPGIKFTDPI